MVTPVEKQITISMCIIVVFAIASSTAFFAFSKNAEIKKSAILTTEVKNKTVKSDKPPSQDIQLIL